MKTFQYASEFSISLEKLFEFHELPIGFQTLVGSAPGVEVIQAPKSLEVGEKAILKIPIFPGIKVEWVAEHTLYKKNEIFRDIQKSGPFRYFEHSHEFKRSDNNPEHSILLDRIQFRALFPWISDHIVPILLKKQFGERHITTAKALGCERRLLSLL